ncbi:MAG TPA: peptidyl-prolyl cis-trans isomerase [Polyangiaceae bacterium]
MSSLGRPWLAALAVVAATTIASANDPDPVVITVGPLTMRASDISRRLAAMPPFQRATLGSTPAEIRKHFVDTVLVPEMLEGAGAEGRQLASRAHVQHEVRDALRKALVESVRKQALAAGVPDAELTAYYDAHRDDYRKPERIRIFRILLDDEALAKKILTEARGLGGPERFSKLARENSVDAATKLRSGALGFVFPDGRTDVPQLTVDPALYAAASKVRDGELCPNPVREGAHFAVVWRRGTLPALGRSLDAERPAITALLVRQRVDATVKALLEDLRKRDVRDENPALLDALPPENPVPPSEERRPGVPRPVNPVPVPSERGLR